MEGFTPFFTVSPEAIVQLYIKKNIYLDFNSRCCRDHLDDCGFIHEYEIENIIIIKKSVKITGAKLTQLLKHIRDRDTKCSSLFNQFKNLSKIPPDLVLDHTGFTRDEFSFIINELKSLKNSEARSKEQALAVYLTWLKTGIPQTTLSSFFGIDNRQISHWCNQVREALIKDYVPQFLGSRSQTRHQWLNKNTDLVKELYNLTDEQFCLIADGTYLYCQKPENNKLQRQLYSCQKKRHLVKPFIVCATNGFIIDVYGPFAATSNDASILLYLMEHSDLKNIALPNDLFFLDRGFRDALKDLTQIHGLIPKVPACI